jgi:hypothetical protein
LFKGFGKSKILFFNFHELIEYRTQPFVLVQNCGNQTQFLLAKNGPKSRAILIINIFKNRTV